MPLDLTTQVAAMEPLIQQLIAEWRQHKADGLQRADLWWSIQALGRLGYAAEKLDASLTGADRQAVVEAVVGVLAQRAGVPAFATSMLVRVAIPALAQLVKWIKRFV